MNTRAVFLICVALGIFGAASQAAAPTVANVRASQRVGTQLVDIYYDVADSDSSALAVSVAVSTNGGAAYFSPGASVSGAIGSGVTPGNNRKITWNAGTDLPPKLFSNVRVSVIASDDTVPPPPAGMVLIPGGSFTMGDTLDTNSIALPLHTVYVSSFYMDKYEVTKAFWDEVYNWAITRGYSFSSGLGRGPTHPVQTVTFSDVIKWCNARSEKEGISYAYFSNVEQTVPIKSGVFSGYVNWSGGYRLPTEAEWEKAARGGVNAQRFPWGNTISHVEANYQAYPFFEGRGYFYDVNPVAGYHPSYGSTNDPPYTSPVGSFFPNQYGLYDMVGNVNEWCWDWYGQYSNVSQSDPRGGPPSGFGRVYRGGSFGSSPFDCRTAGRAGRSQEDPSSALGVRCVLSVAPR